MRSRARLVAALALAALCAPGNIVREVIPDTFPQGADIALERVAGASETGTAGWQVEGVWEYSANSLNFGGFSALMTLGPARLRAFSDRGFRFTFTEPDRHGIDEAYLDVSHQLVARRYANDLWDIEAATRDPVTRDYWLAFENYHGIQRYSISSEPKGVRILEDEFDWYTNSGAEGLVRLSDGRFVIVVEGRGEAVVYPSDPVEGAEPQVIAFASPREGFTVTDMAEMPSGQILMLLRRVDWDRGWPPFSYFLAIADPPAGEPGETWSAEVAVDLDEAIPAENYEGLALRPDADGTLAVWLIADDNRSSLQRNLVVKLRYDP